MKIRTLAKQKKNSQRSRHSCLTNKKVSSYNVLKSKLSERNLWLQNFIGCCLNVYFEMCANDPRYFAQQYPWIWIPGPHSLICSAMKLKKKSDTLFDPDLTYRGVPHDPRYPVLYCTPLVRQLGTIRRCEPLRPTKLTTERLAAPWIVSTQPSPRTVPDSESIGWYFEWGPILKLTSFFISQMWYNDFITGNFGSHLNFYFIFQNQNVAGNVYPTNEQM